MGQSTDAIIAYGYDLNALMDYPDEINWEEFLSQGVRDEIAKVEGYYDLDESLSDWLVKTHGVKGVELVRHCSCDYTMHILGREVVRAWRGDVRTLEWPNLYQRGIDERWKENTIEAARLLEIDVKDQEPHWMLVSMWC